MIDNASLGYTSPLFEADLKTMGTMIDPSVSGSPPRVPALDVPPAHAEDRDYVLDHSAVELFITRATALDTSAGDARDASTSSVAWLASLTTSITTWLTT